MGQDIWVPRPNFWLQHRWLVVSRWNMVKSSPSGTSGHIWKKITDICGLNRWSISKEIDAQEVDIFCPRWDSSDFARFFDARAFRKAWEAGYEGYWNDWGASWSEWGWQSRDRLGPLCIAVCYVTWIFLVWRSAEDQVISGHFEVGRSIFSHDSWWFMVISGDFWCFSGDFWWFNGDFWWFNGDFMVFFWRFSSGPLEKSAGHAGLEVFQGLLEGLSQRHSFLELCRVEGAPRGFILVNRLQNFYRWVPRKTDRSYIYIYISIWMGISINGGTPIAGWMVFVNGKIPPFEMDDHWGYVSGNLHIFIS